MSLSAASLKTHSGIAPCIGHCAIRKPSKSVMQHKLWGMVPASLLVLAFMCVKSLRRPNASGS
eukprot:748794-Amphidinium_carterae.1